MDNKTKIFGVGITGLVGSRIVELLPQYEFTDMSRESGIDMTDSSTLDGIRNDTEHSIVWHLAAKADVDGCEKDKPLGVTGDAYKLNVLGTKNIIDACRVQNKKIIYISTDFVFDGENTPEGGYRETDKPNPVNWYADTKYQAEELVRNSGLSFIIMRIAYPYRSAFPAKKDFFHAILDRLKNNQPVSAITDHLMSPTYVDDIAKALDTLIQTDAQGVFHVVGTGGITPYDASLQIAETFGLDKSLISKTTRADFFKDRATRPFNLTLNNAKIQKLGVSMKTFQEGLNELLSEK